MNDRLSTLEVLIAAGLDLFPLLPRSKKPRDKGWRKIQYTHDQLREWVTAGGNIGVRLSPTDLVIDWDPRNDLMGDSLERFEFDAGMHDASYPSVNTPTTGIHVYATIPAGSLIRAKLKKKYPGLDFKTDGGYVLAPGSIHPDHPDGPLYRLNNGDLTERSLLPEAGLALIRVKPRERAAAMNDEMSFEYLALLVSHLDLDGYSDWIEIGMAINRVTGGSDEGLDLWVAHSRRFARPDTDEACKAHWESFDPNRPDGVGAGTIRHRVQDAIGHLPPDPDLVLDFDPAPLTVDLPDGAPVPVPPGTEGERVPYKGVKRGIPKAYLYNAILGLRSLRLDLARDLWWDTIRVRGDLSWLRARYPAFGDEWGDSSITAVREILLARDHLDLSKDQVQDAAETLAYQNAFNPLTDWLRSLTWDGEARLDGWLTRYAGVEDSEYTQAVARRVLVAAVARAFIPGTKFDCMLVMEGVTGIGKSRLVEAVGGEYFSTGLATTDLRSKDAIDAIRTSWVIEMDEMEVMRRTDIAILKSFLSRVSDKARLAYRRNVEEFRRCCVLIGTTEEHEYLRDSRGARRFWPVEARPVTIDGWLDVDGFEAARDQIFAEAVAVWDACPTSESLTLDKVAEAQAKAVQDDRYEEDAWQVPIERALRGGEKGEKALEGEALRLVDIVYHALYVSPGDQNYGHQKRAGDVMRRLKWTRVRIRQGSEKVWIWRRPK